MKSQNTGNVNTDLGGTYLQGYIQTTRARLEKTFGPAMTHYLPESVSLMWILNSEQGHVISLYVRSDYPPAMDEVVTYSIGAITRDAVAMVHEAFRKANGLNQVTPAAS